MARGFIGRVQTVLGFAGIVALGVTASLISGVNPLEHADEALSGVAEKLKGRLSEPLPRWSERVDGRALAARVTGGNVVVVLHGAVEALRLADGGPAWSRTVDWAVPVDDVVVAGRAEGGGFEVLEPFTGTVSWSDPHAEEVWPYADVVLSVSCRRDCVLRARSSGNGKTRWRRVLDGAADRLSGYQDFDDAVDRAGLLHPDHPGPAPRLVGVVGDRRVSVIDTRSGAVAGRFAHDAHTWVTVTGERVLTTVARPIGNGCRYTIRGWEPSGRQLWRRTGYDPGTVSGSGCEQRSDPVVVGGVLSVTAADGRPVLIGVRRGEVRWAGRPGDALLATDGRIAVVRGRKTGELTAVDLRTGKDLWSRTAKRSHVVVTSAAVLISEPEAGTVTAVSPVSGGELASWRTDASPVGLDRSGVVLGSGRSVGYAAW
ncbi:MAG TPA: PQQ-binding-like beta-propeller repeat protein [Micromonosporaceae bacterium]